jgi:hypothetical protein
MFKTKLAVAFTAAALIAPTAEAAVVAVGNPSISASGPGSVGYVSFNISTAGAYDIYTLGPTTDPELFLFSDGDSNGFLDATFDTLVAQDDDSCPNTLCGYAGAFKNSLITTFLSAGNYIAAVSDFPFYEAEAFSGESTNNLTGNIAIVVATSEIDLPSVPVPAGLPLLVGGLGLFGFMRRKAKK